MPTQAWSGLSTGYIHFACLCAHVCVQEDYKNPQERSEWTGLSRPDLRFFLPLNIFPAALPVSRRDTNSPQLVLVCLTTFLHSAL